MQHIHGMWVTLERLMNNGNRPVDPGAKTARPGKEDVHGCILVKNLKEGGIP
jgi:hypothetical protein